MNRRNFLGVAAASTTALATYQFVVQAEEKELPPPDKLGKTPHTKFAVNIEAWWPRLPFLERIKKTAEYGYPAFEFWPWRNHNVEKIAETAAKHNVEIAQFSAWGFTPGMNDPKNHDRFVKEVEASCRTAKKINCKKMCVVGGNDIPGMTQAEMHQNIITALKKAAPIAEQYQVMLILEPMNIRVDHKGHCLYGTEPAVKITRAVGSPFVKVLFDLYHSHITEGDLCGHIKDGIDQLGYVQIADHPGRHEPGTGEIHYPRVLRQLKESGYDGHVGLELWPSKGELAAAQAVWRADQW